MIGEIGNGFDSQNTREPARATEEEIDYAISTIRINVEKLRELCPLWEMVKDGVDLSTIQWAAH